MVQARWAAHVPLPDNWRSRPHRQRRLTIPTPSRAAQLRRGRAIKQRMDFASALFGQAGNRDASPHDARPCQHAAIDTGPSTSTRAHDASATRCAGWWTATTLPRSSDLQEHAARRYVQATLTLSELKQLASDLAGPCTSMQGQQLHLALADGSNAASGRPTWRRGRSSTRGLRPTPGGASGSAKGRLDLADAPG